MEPDIVLADEPTGNLDTGSGSDVMGALQELWDGGATLMVVTHDTALAERANRVVEIRDGKVVQDTTNS
jgi:ABC-type lipoprotein export system ATPase subunit